ncbi:MAG: hypothetical protein EB127_14400 [Alphaproteobacteria bacterium]|nr:hypothetical protein [Alphaproteobacteria bacterium]
MKSFKEYNKQKEIIKDFVEYTSKELGLKSPPKVDFSDSKEEALENRSFGYYHPGENRIMVNTAGRHLADILRTLGHEMVHHKQNEDGRLHAMAGETGSSFENEANAQAGVLLRNYGKTNPTIYEDYENPYRFDWGTPAGTNYMTKLTPGQPFKPQKLLKINGRILSRLKKSK